MDDGAKRHSAGATAQKAINFAAQAEKLSHKQPAESPSSVAIQAHFVTPHDAVIITSDGGRLPGVPLEEAHKLNMLRDELEGKPDGGSRDRTLGAADDDDDAPRRALVHVPERHNAMAMQRSAGGTLRRSMPPSHTNPLFPPLPLYGPPSIMREMQCLFLRISSFFLSLAFLAVIVLGALFTSAPAFASKLLHTVTLRDADQQRPFHQEEKRRAAIRRQSQQSWEQRASASQLGEDEEGDFHPTQGGRDPIVCDVGYYARRVGLDVETYEVQTEDGFVLELWHVFDPKEYTKRDEEKRGPGGPTATPCPKKQPQSGGGRPKFPVLLIHGLLQSSGAYCCNDDESLAFWLCKSGFDVWLGNNRCGFKPRHTKLEYSDARMWSWNIRQMGVFDLPALTSRVLTETGFEKLGLICHSQGTTETFVALAKEQRPDLGDRLTVFCALAPAAYAGPLIGKIYFKFMRVISPAMFRIMFGVHAFIPLMMDMHALLPPRLYGWLGYKVFSFLFNWSDRRWDRGLRDRMFQFAPVYVSAESMRWWLGRECFAKHKCILATRETTKAEDRMDAAEDRMEAADGDEAESSAPSDSDLGKGPSGATAWYDAHAPPFALWVCGSDDLVDGKRLLRRFGNGREPHVRVVHSAVIDEYEHLDVIWAMDAVDRVFHEVREVLWKTCNARDVCRVPTGCEGVEAWTCRRREEEEE